MNCGEPIIDGLLASDGSISPLTQGATGAAVAYLQDLLRGHGYSLMPDPRVTGYGDFGVATSRAVSDFSSGVHTVANHAVLSDLTSRPTNHAALSPAWLPLVLGIPFTTTARFIWLSSLFETGGAFGALNRNTDGSGLSFGLLQWSQRSSQLHNLLKACKFDQTVVDYTARPNGGLNVEGWAVDPAFELTRDPWLTKLKALATDPAIQRVQITLATEAYQTQMNRIESWYSVAKSERLMAFLLDLCNQFGPSRVEKQYTELATLPESEIMQKLEDSFTALASPAFQPQVRLRRAFFRTTRLLSDELLQNG